MTGKGPSGAKDRQDGRMAGATGARGLTEAGPTGKGQENPAGGHVKQEQPETSARSPQGRRPRQAAVVTVRVRTAGHTWLNVCVCEDFPQILTLNPQENLEDRCSHYPILWMKN